MYVKPAREVIKSRRMSLYNALMSGDYEQGFGYLKTLYDGKPRYCCLGVAVEVAIKLGLDVFVEDDGHVVSFDDHEDILSSNLFEFYGFDNGNPDITVQTWETEFDDTCSVSNLAELNDSERYDLREVAAVFKKDFIDTLD